MLITTWSDYIYFNADPAPLPTIACDFEHGNICGYSDISLHNMAKWESIKIDAVYDIPGDMNIYL